MILKIAKQALLEGRSEAGYVIVYSIRCKDKGEGTLQRNVSLYISRSLVLKGCMVQLKLKTI